MIEPVLDGVAAQAIISQAINILHREESSGSSTTYSRRPLEPATVRDEASSCPGSAPLGIRMNMIQGCTCYNERNLIFVRISRI